MAKRCVHLRLLALATILPCASLFAACLGSDAQTRKDAAIPATPTAIRAGNTGRMSADAGDAPTPEESVRVVRAYFAGVDADSYERMREQTSGQASGRTNELIGEILRQEGEVGIDSDLRVTELDVSVQAAEGVLQPVSVDCEIAAYVDAGLINMKLRTVRSSATFMVARTPGGAKVVELKGQLTP